MHSAFTSPTPTTQNFLICFADFSSFYRSCLKLEDRTIYELMDEYFILQESILAKSDGTVIKVIGDASLILFPEESASQGISTLLELKQRSDEYMEDKGLKCKLILKIHFGEAVIGHLQGINPKRPDVYGKNINHTAVMRSFGISLSPQAFRKLNPEQRKSFKKHTPPVRYIPGYEPHQD